MSDFEIKEATRDGVKPLIGLYGESGCGKTLSALLLARGFVGPTGKIVMIDTESGRGSIYVDEIPGKYHVLQLKEPFSPQRYAEAVRTADNGAGIIIIDSMTHEWSSTGGVQDMAAAVAMRRAEKWNREWDGTIQFGDWKQPKMEHAKLIYRMFQCACPVICCIRAKHKSRQLKGTKEMADAGLIRDSQIGKEVVIKDDFATPIQEEDFIFEMMVHGEVKKDHSLEVTKDCIRELRACFPTSGPITMEHGKLLAQWCAAPSKSPQGVNTADELRKRLWDATKAHHGGSRTKLGKWLLYQSLIGDAETVPGLSADRLSGILSEIEKRQSDLVP